MEFLLLEITKLEKLQEKEQMFKLFPNFWIKKKKVDIIFFLLGVKDLLDFGSGFLVYIKLYL